MAEQTKALLEVESIKKYFPIEKGFFKKTVGYIKAVDNVSFSINKGNCLGIVGESGCGKTTLGRCVIRAIEPTEGKVCFKLNDNEKINFTKLDKDSLRRVRKHINMIFQDPYSSLDERMTVLDIVGEPLVELNVSKGKKMEKRVKELIYQVGLDIKHIRRYPYAFSGGQRQRIGIARALATSPDFIVADEPVSALDVSIQAQILNLLQDLQEELDLTYLFIAHDLSVIRHISDRVSVMYVGKIVENAETEDLFTKPRHPYTEALLSVLPVPDPDIKRDKIILSNEIANPANPPSGCYFHPRCMYAEDICKKEEPELNEISSNHFVKCHLAKELDLKGF